MKRLLTLCVVFILALTTAACSGGAGGGEEPADSKKKILYVSQDTENDSIIIKRLTSLGYEVTKASDKDLKKEDADGFDLIYIANTARHGEVAGVFKQSTVPTFIQKAAYAYVVGTLGKQSDAGSLEYQTKIKIKDAAHPIAAGLSGTVDVYKVGGYIGVAKPGKNATIIATAPDDESQATIFTYEKGAKDASPFEAPVPARQVFFYLMGGEETNQTDNSWKMFEAALTWVMEKPAQ